MKNESEQVLEGEILAPNEEGHHDRSNLISISDLSAETQKHAIRISENWRGVATSIIETGRAITEARKALKKKPAELGLLDEYIRNRLKIDVSARNKLELIGKKSVFTLENNTERLPTAVATLYQLTRVSDDELKNALSTGVVTPATTLVEVNKMFFTPKAKKKKPALTVSISGAPKNIPADKLAALSGLLDEFEAFISVKRSGF